MGLHGLLQGQPYLLPFNAYKVQRLPHWNILDLGWTTRWSVFDFWQEIFRTLQRLWSAQPRIQWRPAAGGMKLTTSTTSAEFKNAWRCAEGGGGYADVVPSPSRYV
jgi:hypothetical protein